LFRTILCFIESQRHIEGERGQNEEYEAKRNREEILQNLLVCIGVIKVALFGTSIQ